MKKFPSFSQQSLISKNLEEKLKLAIDKQNKIEDNYRETNQKYWTILFIDVSYSAEKVWDLGEERASKIFASYQIRVRDVLKKHAACFVEPGGGPQVVCCFEYPTNAIKASNAVLHAVKNGTRNRKKITDSSPQSEPIWDTLSTMMV